VETSVREAVVQSLRGLRLMGYDWDGAKGLPMRGDVADTVFEVFGSSGYVDPSGYVEPLISDAYVESLPLPAVSLNGNGTVEVAFDGEDGRELLLTFECEGVITFIKAFGDGQTTVDGVIRLDLGERGTDEAAELSELLGWVIAE
jgi:hypothetical protein